MGKRAHYYSAFQELQQKVLNAWRTYAKGYRDLIPKYQSLLAEKRRLKANEHGYTTMPINKVNKDILDGLMQIPFFDIETEEEAIDFIKELEYGELRKLANEIEVAVDSKSYITIKSRIIDYGHQINHWNDPKHLGAMDPTYPVSSNQRNKTAGKRSNNGMDG